MNLRSRAKLYEFATFRELCDFSRDLFTTLSQLRIVDSELEFDVTESVLNPTWSAREQVMAVYFGLSSQTIHDNCPEGENYWSQKYSGKNENKMKKCYHFLFSY